MQNHGGTWQVDLCLSEGVGTRRIAYREFTGGLDGKIWLCEQFMALRRIDPELRLDGVRHYIGTGVRDGRVHWCARLHDRHTPTTWEHFDHA